MQDEQLQVGYRTYISQLLIEKERVYQWVENELISSVFDPAHIQDFISWRPAPYKDQTLSDVPPAFAAKSISTAILVTQVVSFIT